MKIVKDSVCVCAYICIRQSSPEKETEPIGYVCGGVGTDGQAGNSGWS